MKIFFEPKILGMITVLILPLIPQIQISIPSNPSIASRSLHGNSGFQSHCHLHPESFQSYTRLVVLMVYGNHPNEALVISVRKQWKKHPTQWRGKDCHLEAPSIFQWTKFQSRSPLNLPRKLQMDWKNSPIQDGSSFSIQPLGTDNHIKSQRLTPGPLISAFDTETNSFVSSR